ncbi:MULTISPECIES: tRNA pseudouridine(38-40) synthase TruA [unclassified Clostridioides]|uniref:tRNA pseudouridine(38-40) synthase TruA n=1 Tax=unclassified Clostridioides TaxID=2635829 RepID=UPI001D1177F8|nr:tRNA pseudouridine(38-40) synthase TruA [Clostridioides sp. ES-S-0171-01]MCC0687357.1 tRNA pseudouridine(38-40) synthase TruA [Clostridioides sp. ES-S-0056-01]MCC0714358.1 tRNA pseudouridine(38-40) synthase TruA [Clostridioides sp. ES-S-0077-01]UDN56233.1 tRNA pseudouridine(38-40) synthase TruA [Clostridioides sp. ES-S-0054-01]
MRNIKMIVAYDGSRYKGYQKLGDNNMTIQEKLETVLSKMTNETVEIIGSGRTDMGAHARGQVINFRTNCMDSVDKIQKYLYEYLPEDIVVKAVEEVDERFHSRYNVKSKTYMYRIDNNKYHNPFIRRYATHVSKKLDLDRMRKASEYLIGEHDFTSFASSKSKKKSNVREIYSINIKEDDNIVEIYIEGNGFLYNMVRIIVGALMDVGLKRIAPQDIKYMLESKDRSQSSDTAPAKGLCLWKVRY